MKNISFAKKVSNINNFPLPLGVAGGGILKNSDIQEFVYSCLGQDLCALYGWMSVGFLIYASYSILEPFSKDSLLHAPFQWKMQYDSTE